jgi:hypothetical protein
MLSLYRVTAILFLCFFSSACSIWRCTPPNPPEWVKSGIPPYGGKNAAVGCSTHINTSEQANDARTIALHNLAQQLGGVVVDGKTGMEVKEEHGAITSDIEVKIKIGTIKTAVSAVPEDTWADDYGNKSCVWMKTTD